MDAGRGRMFDIAFNISGILPEIIFRGKDTCVGSTKRRKGYFMSYVCMYYPCGGGKEEYSDTYITSKIDVFSLRVKST